MSDLAKRDPDPIPSRSWWIGRCWMIVGSWLLLAAVFTLLPSILMCLAGDVVTVSSWIVDGLKALLICATGVACLWAGKQRFARVVDRPDLVMRFVTALKTPRALAVMAGTIVAVTIGLIVTWPWIDSVSTVQWIREDSGIRDMDRIHDLHGGTVGDFGFVSGRVEPDDQALFIRDNDLATDYWGSRSRWRQFSEWEKHRPADPDWYSREGRRPNDTCKMQCDVVCLLDRRSGRVWISLRGPDFAGD